MNHDSCSMKKVANEVAVCAGKPGSFALEPAPAHIPGIWAWSGSIAKPTLKRPVRLAVPP